MAVGNVIDFYTTSFGIIHIIDVIDSETPLDFETKLEYNGIEFRITYFFGLGSHDYYNRGTDILYPRKVWSCVLEDTQHKGTNVNIPIGAKLLLN
jgi:hypothetical protein